MATAASVLRSWRLPAEQQRAQVGWRDNFITILMGLWLMIGLFIDGWAHNTLGSTLESFFTPWHAVFYSGYTANVAWIGYLLLRQYHAGRRDLAVIPRGYHLGVLGVLVFGAGGVGDMLWHIIFGIEVNLEALLSPTHLLLFLGGMLIFASPFLATWQSNDPAGDAPSFVAFLPALGALTMMTSFVSFMNMYLWAPLQPLHTTAMADWITTNHWSSRRVLTQLTHELGVENILISNLILIAPVLLVLRRWQPPFGAVTFLYTLNAILMAALRGFENVDSIAIALISGLVADTLIKVLHPRSDRVAAYRVVAIAIPLVYWSLFFAGTLFRSGIAWSAEFVGGATVMAALTGLALSLLMTPPALPARLASSP